MEDKQRDQDGKRETVRLRQLETQTERVTPRQRGSETRLLKKERDSALTERLIVTKSEKEEIVRLRQRESVRLRWRETVEVRQTERATLRVRQIETGRQTQRETL